MERKGELPTKEKQKIIQLIVFRVGDEEFGVPIESVQEIIKMGVVTPIPDSPEFIKGLINVRGDIVAIIDVRARFFLTAAEEMAKHIVIAKQEESLFGLLVDEVMEVLRIQESDIKPRPHLMTKIHEEYVHGVITHEGRLIILLDLNQVLSEDELIRLAEMARKHHKHFEQGDSKEVEDVPLAIKTESTDFKRKKIHGKQEKS